MYLARYPVGYTTQASQHSSLYTQTKTAQAIHPTSPPRLPLTNFQGLVHFAHNPCPLQQE